MLPCVPYTLPETPSAACCTCFSLLKPARHNQACHCLHTLQEAAVAADRCQGLERQAASLTSQLAAAAAQADVAAGERQQLQAAIDSLTLRLEQKEARMRSSMGALARASSSLRASLASAQVRRLARYAMP